MSWNEPDEEEIRAAFADEYRDLKGVKDNQTEPRRRAKLDHKRKGKKGRTSPVIEYVRALGDYKVASEVAEELGVSPAFVRKLAKIRATQAPSKVAPFGDTHVFLYTEEDVEALRKYIDSKRVVYDYDDYPFEGEKGK